MRLVPSTASDDPLRVSEVVLLWLAVSIVVAVAYWARLDDSFASTDNLMRLVQVRALLDGAPWFDPHEPRLAPPLGYDTHWSRLIDAGIAGLIVAFEQIVSLDLAERLARCIWPLLLSGPAVFAVVAIAIRLGGEGAGRAVFIPALLTPALFPTFRPGEIDHHNAQVMLSLVLIACALWCDRRAMAACAGVAGGALLSVGLEAAYVPMAMAAAFALLLVFDPAWHRAARDFGAALAISTIAGYLAITPAALRFAAQCDTLAINSVCAVAIGAAGLCAVACFGKDWDRRMRFGALSIAAACAAAAYVWMEPRCLSGPFGLVDRTIFSLWLDRVEEMQPLAGLFRKEGFRSTVYVAFPVVATLAVLLTIRTGLRTPLGWALVASYAVATGIMIGQIRILVYVIWFGLPFIGVAAQTLAVRTRRPRLIRIVAAVLASPAAVTLLVAIPLSQSALARGNDEADKDMELCHRRDSYRTLAALPPGLVLAPLDLGPSILAHTRQSVVAAPYHRADKAIRFNQEIMDGGRDARERIISRGIRYVISCIGYRRQTNAGSFHEALFAGDAGSWLEPVPGTEGEPIRIWRVVPSRR